MLAISSNFFLNFRLALMDSEHTYEARRNGEDMADMRCCIFKSLIYNLVSLSIGGRHYLHGHITDKENKT